MSTNPYESAPAAARDAEPGNVIATEWDFRGHWLGQYKYDPNPSLPQTPVVSFILTLKRTWLGKMRGSVQDDPSTGMPETGIILGKVKGLDIEFVKLMPVCYLLVDGKSVRFSQHLGLDRDLPAPEIHYRGSYVPAEEMVRGTWGITPRTIRLRNFGSVYSYKFARCTGTWEMRRQAEGIALEKLEK
jgi:hypothetical protein